MSASVDYIRRVCELSPFFAGLLDQHSQLAESALSTASDSQTKAQLVERYTAFLAEQNETDVAEKLRRLRLHEMIRIIYRDFLKLSDLNGTTEELSHLADFCVGYALDHAFQEARDKYGTPLNPNGEPQNLIVLAMGKLGAFELNLSSDIDLIFLYESPGQLETMSHQEFYLRMARRVIALLDDSNQIANVFRVDLRLRPYGDSGPLVLNRSAMEKYYVEQGRDWERYAFIKARCIAGDVAAGRDFLEWMQPFVYRRHLDFGAIQSLREMKSLIERQVELRELNSDLKLGPGGIREIEFIAQAYQLIWGGKHLALQDARLQPTLAKLAELGFIPNEEVEALLSAYTFLRNSEHAIQGEHDRQIHTLPDSEESRERLAAVLGFENYDDYANTLQTHRDFVSDCFARLITAERKEDEVQSEEWLSLWQQPAAGTELEVFRTSVSQMTLDQSVLSALDALMPQLLRLCSGKDSAQSRMLTIVRSVLRRSTYLVFLNENRDALERAVRVVEDSAFLADQLATYPILLYELTDRAVEKVSVSRQQLEGELRELLRSIDIEDLETRMDSLRQFKLAVTLKIGVMELFDGLSIMEASDALTALAEVILESSIEMAWQHLSGRHGVPCDHTGEEIPERISIIGYGKAGGLELAYGSDLDLVFLCPNDIQASTNGTNPVNNNVFYVRLGQRIIHILASPTRFGSLYDVDMRLRPSGNKGPLVATLRAFEKYQLDDAWIWEHQALVRARFLAGDEVLGQRFNTIRHSILTQPRERSGLLNSVLDMREKMRIHLGSGASTVTPHSPEFVGIFDLKHDAGAIVDIEFMVQYAVLGWAAEIPALCRWTDMMRLLDELAIANVYSQDEVDSLQRAYLAFRAANHHSYLGLSTDFERLGGYRDEVSELWTGRMSGEM